MKKNDMILMASVFIYSCLFYMQGFGINFLVFTVCLVTLLLFKNKEVLKNRSWQLAAAGSLVSAVCIALYGNGLSFIANIISLCLLSAFSINPATSVSVSMFFSFYSIFLSGIFMIIDFLNRYKNRLDRTGKRFPSRFLSYAVSVFIALIFFFMYKSSNPVFDNFTSKINLDFISFGWVFFTLSGLFLMYGFFYHRNIPFVAGIDESLSNSLTSASIKEDSLLSKVLPADSERLSGTVLLLMLNVLLITVNILDLNYLWFNGALPSDLSYSQFVHQGTGILITSIIIAIGIIMFYFRGALNFYKENKILKILAFLWIAQNAFMIISTAYRNQLYIDEYSLTYLRIGVYVWLMLALIGLVTTWIKIQKIKTNWFLFRTNAWMFYAVLVVSCLINWDVMVTGFNISRAEQNKKALDRSYLLSLSDKNISQLLRINDSVRFQDDQPESNSAPADYRLYNSDFKDQLEKKISQFVGEMKNRDWQSWSYYDNKVYQDVLNLYTQGKIIL